MLRWEGGCCRGRAAPCGSPAPRPARAPPAQEDPNIGRASTADDQQLAYWTHRYALRADPTYAGPPSEAGAFNGGGLDVPAILWPCREAVLTTGARARRAGGLGGAASDAAGGCVALRCLAVLEARTPKPCSHPLDTRAPAQAST